MKTLLALLLPSLALSATMSIRNVEKMTLQPPWLTVIETGQNGYVWRCPGADTTEYQTTKQVVSPALCTQDRPFANGFEQ
jgi:hypothetical protein